MTFSDAVSAISANNVLRLKQYLLLPSTPPLVEEEGEKVEALLSRNNGIDGEDDAVVEDEEFNLNGQENGEKTISPSSEESPTVKLKDAQPTKLLSVDAKSRKGYSLLYRAASLGRAEICQFLLENGANFYHGYDVRNRLRKIRNAYLKLTLLKSGYRTNSKMSVDGFDRVVDHINRTKLLVSDLSDRRMSPLLVAAQNGHDKGIRVLLNHARKVGRIEEKLWRKFDDLVLDFQKMVKQEREQHQGVVEHKEQVNQSETTEQTYGDGGEADGWTTVQTTKTIPSFSNNAQTKLCYDMVEETFHAYTALHLACKYGHPKVVSLLLRESSELLHARNRTGALALHIATKHNHVEVVKIMLTYPELSINAIDYNGWTALHVAIAEKHKEILKLLLEDKRTEYLRPEGSFLCSVCDDNILHMAVKSKNARIVQIVLNAMLKRKLSSSAAYGNLDSKMLYGLNLSQFSPIDIAIGGRYKKILTYFKSFLEKNRAKLSPDVQNYNLAWNPHAMHSLVKTCLIDEDIALATELKEVNPNIFRNKLPVRSYSWSSRYNYYPRVSRHIDPVHFCVMYEKLRILDFLLANKLGSLHFSLIHLACRRNKFAALCKMLDYPKLKSKMNNLSGKGKSPLYYAIRSDNVRMVKRLLETGIDVNLHGEKALPPFLLACYKNNPEIIELLINHKETNVSCIDPIHERSSLHFLASKESLDSIKFIQAIIAKDPLLVYKQDKNRNTALHIATKHGCFETAQLLLKSGAPLNILNYNDMMPISYTFSKGMSRKSYISSGYEQLFYMMLEKSQDVNLKMKGAVSLLHKVAEWGDLKAFTLLIEKHGARLQNNETYKGWNPLHVAVWYENFAIVEYILKQNVIDVEQGTRSQGLRPLHMAYLKRNSRIANLLMGAGASLNAVNIMGQTPVHFAARRYGSLFWHDLLGRQASLARFDHHGYSPIHAALHSLSNFYSYTTRRGFGFGFAVVRSYHYGRPSFAPLDLLSRESDPDNLHAIIRQHYKHGTTIVHECARWGSYLTMVMRQATKGSNALEQLRAIMFLTENTKGSFTPLMTAVYHRNQDAVNSIFQFIEETFEKCGTRYSCTAQEFIKELINFAPGALGFTALHIAFWKNIDIPLASKLVELGGDLNQRDFYGRTCMHFLCSSRSVTEEEIQQFAHLGMRFNIPDNRFSNDALFIFIIRRDKALVSYLIDQKLIQVNKPINRNGDTYLHIACQKGNKRQVKCLLALKADMSKKNKQGYTPACVAKKTLQKFILGKQYHTSMEKISVKLAKDGQHRVSSKKKGKSVVRKRTKKLDLTDDYGL